MITLWVSKIIRMIRLVTLFLFLPILSFSQNWQWTKKGDVTSQNSLGAKHSICADGMGNCYAAVDSAMQEAKILKYNSLGKKIWQVNLWSGSAKAIASDNSRYIYVAGDSPSQTMLAKYDTSGTMIWKVNGGKGSCNGISLDNLGSIYLTGKDTNYLKKYDTSGNQLWARNINAYVEGNSVCVDNLGNCYVTGQFGDTASFGSTFLNAFRMTDIFITKYDSSGNCLWAKRAGGINYNNYSLSRNCANAVIADKLGYIYITGSFIDTADFDSFTLIASGANSYSGNDLFLAKYDANGNALWVKQAINNSDQEGRCIAIDKQNNVLIGGSFVPSTTFDGVSLTGWGNYDAFVAKYDSYGNFINAIAGGGSWWNEYVYGICTDNLGNTFVTGNFSSKINYFGPDTLVGLGYTVFVSKINMDVNTGIKEIKNDSFNLNIYPNPSNGFFTVEVDEKINVSEIQLTDLLGNIVLRIPPNNQTKFKIDNLERGVYILTVIDKNNRTTNRKIISTP